MLSLLQLFLGAPVGVLRRDVLVGGVGMSAITLGLKPVQVVLGTSCVVITTFRARGIIPSGFSIQATPRTMVGTQFFFTGLVFEQVR